LEYGRIGEKHIKKLVTINFIGYDKLNIKYNLSKTMEVELYKGFAWDNDIHKAIQKSIKGTSIVKYEIKRDNFMGAPIWEDICDIPVVNSIDY